MQVVLRISEFRPDFLPMDIARTRVIDKIGLSLGQAGANEMARDRYTFGMRVHAEGYVTHDIAAESRFVVAARRTGLKCRRTPMRGVIVTTDNPIDAARAEQLAAREGGQKC